MLGILALTVQYLSQRQLREYHSDTERQERHTMPLSGSGPGVRTRLRPLYAPYRRPGGAGGARRGAETETVPELSAPSTLGFAIDRVAGGQWSGCQPGIKSPIE
jgi:hypothetical protein